MVNVQHLERVSDELAELSDELSQKEQRGNAKSAEALSRAEFKEVTDFF